MKKLLFLLSLFMFLFPQISSAAPMILDPNYSLTLVATGLGAAGDMAIDNEGNLFINDYRDPGTGSGRIHWFKPNGERVVINSNLYYQDGIAVLPNGNLLVAPDALYEVTRDGVVSLYLTGLSYPGHMEPDGLGNFYISEGGAGRITILHPDKSTETFASGLNNPNGTTFDDQGHLWVTEHFLGSVVELDSTGQKIREISGFPPYGPSSIEFWDGSLFVGNTIDASIYRVEKDGSWNYFATGFTGKANPPFIGPGVGLAVGNILYIIDADNLWKIDKAPNDTDEDGILDVSDNCPDIPNPTQEDNDFDGLGDVCDEDDDNDGVADTEDNCVFYGNAEQTDVDNDGLGDVCDEDMDGDGYGNTSDNCPVAPNVDQIDTDNDGAGDECDGNDDNDTLPDGDDNCPTIVNDDQADLDADGIGDACDIDIDGDGVGNDGDTCPLVSNTSQDDTDSDGLGDACDEDDDNDGYLDDNDNCKLIVNDQSDLDGDGKGDVCDSDLDGDGVANEIDNCPNAANSSQNDMDGDGLGDACDPDMDGDGVANGPDLCAGTSLGVRVDPSTGCSIVQLCPCDGPMGTTDLWRNHGKYVSCVARSSESFVEMGLITEIEKDAVVSEAAVSVCGHKK